MTTFVRMPMLNANDESAVLIAWLVDEADSVTEGQAIAEIETTKTTGDIDAPEAGHLRIRVPAGEEVPVGAVIAAVTPTAGEPVEWPTEIARVTEPEAPAEDRGWTKKAEMVAERAGVDIALVAAQADGRVGVADVEAYLEENTVAHADLADDVYQNDTPRRLAIMGGGQGALQVIDIVLRRSDMTAVAIFDDDPKLHGRTISQVPVVGPIDAGADDFRRRDFDSAIVAVGADIEARRRVFTDVRATGVTMANVIDPSVVIGTNASLGVGNLIMPFGHIGPATRIGDNNFISAHTNIEHHSTVGSHCTFGPAVFFSGRVTVGDSVKFGTGIHVEPWNTIGDEAIIASGVTVTAPIPARTIAKANTTPTHRPR